MATFNDISAVHGASFSSTRISEIDLSWREYAEKLTKQTLHLPFGGEYQIKTTNSCIIILGYQGSLEIKFLTYKQKMYALRQPYTCDPYKVYGIFSEGKLIDYISEPIFGVHYVGLNSAHDKMPICLGDLELPKPSSFEMLRDNCKKIVNTMKMINLESIGVVNLPEDNFSKILKSSSTATIVKLTQMLEYNLIRSIL